MTWTRLFLLKLTKEKLFIIYIIVFKFITNCTYEIRNAQYLCEIRCIMLILRLIHSNPKNEKIPPICTMTNNFIITKCKKVLVIRLFLMSQKDVYNLIIITFLSTKQQEIN